MVVMSIGKYEKLVSDSEYKKYIETALDEAAKRILDEIENEILNRVYSPISYEKYFSNKKEKIYIIEYM